MARAQSGDRDAYRHLLEAITPYLRSLAAQQHRTPSDVEDVVQDILLTVHAVRHTYDPARPFAPWLTAIARRRIIDRLRYRTRQAAREVPLDAQPETFAMAAPNHEEPALIAGRLRQAIAALPVGQRRAVELLRLEELSLKEAAVKSGMTVGALKVAVHRGLKALRASLVRAGMKG